MADALLLRFGTEELVYLLRVLRIDHLHGVDARKLANLDDDHTTLALAVADRALRARGTIVWETPERRQLNHVAASVLRACAEPRFTATVEIARAGAQTSLYVYSFIHQLVVEHANLEPGVHQFTALGAASDLISWLNDLLPFTASATATGEPGQIARGDLKHLPTPTPDTYEATARLLARSLPPGTAAGLASAMAAPNARVELALWQGRPDTDPHHAAVATLEALDGAAGLWMLVPTPGHDGLVDVVPATTPMVSAQFASTLRPALETLLRAAH